MDVSKMLKNVQIDSCQACVDSGLTPQPEFHPTKTALSLKKAFKCPSVSNLVSTRGRNHWNGSTNNVMSASICVPVCMGAILAKACRRPLRPPELHFALAQAVMFHSEKKAVFSLF